MMITNNYKLSDYTCSNKPSVTLGKVGHTCGANSFLSNNSSGYFSHSLPQFLYGDKMGSNLTFTCNKVTGAVTSVDLK